MSFRKRTKEDRKNFIIRDENRIPPLRYEALSTSDRIFLIFIALVILGCALYVFIKFNSYLSLIFIIVLIVFTLKLFFH